MFWLLVKVGALDGSVGPEPWVCMWRGAGTVGFGANRSGTSVMEDFVCYAKKL